MRLHWSQLKHIGRSPAHYRWNLEHPIEMTPAMRLGWLVHQLAFEQDDYAVYEGTRRGKAWQDFQEHSDGAVIVTAAELGRATAIAESVWADPVAKAALDSGDWERYLQWDIAGRACAGTPDVVADAGVVDLKTTADASPHKFYWQAIRMGYHAQLAWYGEARRILHGRAPKSYRIVAVETKPPYAVAVYRLDESAIEAGTRLWWSMFERLRVCEEADSWPSYSQCELPLSVEDDVTLTIDGEEITI